MKETLDKLKAFDIYYAMGNGRSLSKLEENKDMSLICPRGVPCLKTLKRWSKEFNWQKRIEQRDIENAKRIEKKTDDTIVNTKADYRQRIVERLKELKVEKDYLTRLYGTAKAKIESGTLKVESVRDITELAKAMQGVDKEEQSLIKLDMLLMGESDSSAELIIVHKFVKKDDS